jgi:hypothetical protein
MSIPNEHRNAEHTERVVSFNPSPVSTGSICDAPGSWDAPDPVDMFSRWIKLSDDALAANRKARKKGASRNRRALGPSRRRSQFDFEFSIQSCDRSKSGAATKAARIS